VTSVTNETGGVTTSTNSVTVPNAQSPWAFAKIFQTFTKP
jgi:hypothetical protein